MSSPIEAVLTDAAGTVLAAGAGALLFAQFMGLRLCIRLRRVATILRSVRSKTYEGFTGKSDMSLCDQAKEEAEVTLSDIEREADGIFRLSRPFKSEIESLHAEITQVKEAVFSDLFFSILGYDSVSPTAMDKSRNLESRFLKASWRALAPWRFFLP